MFDDSLTFLLFVSASASGHARPITQDTSTREEERETGRGRGRAAPERSEVKRRDRKRAGGGEWRESERAIARGHEAARDTSEAGRD